MNLPPWNWPTVHEVSNLKATKKISKNEKNEKKRLTAIGSSLHRGSNNNSHTTDEHTPAPSVSVCEPPNRGEGGDLSQLVFVPLVRCMQGWKMKTRVVMQETYIVDHKNYTRAGALTVQTK